MLRQVGTVLALAICAVFMCSQAQAADVVLLTDKINKRPVIRISGEIQSGDEKKLRDLAVSVQDGIVLLDGPGGDLLAGLEIGKIIRLRGYATAVVEEYCYSSCALAWLAGQPRYFSGNPRIGFHAAATYGSAGERQTTGHGNALIGAYANSLGLSETAIRFLTSPEKDKMNYLTREIGDLVGITAERLDDKSEAYAHHNRAVTLKNGTPPDFAGALYHYGVAASAGFAGAQNNLGDMYENGLGIPKNEVVATYWYTRAAERGEPTAYLSLSTLLTKTSEDEATLVEAAKFAFLALKALPNGKNHQTAKATLKKLAAKLPEDRLKLAYEYAKNWSPLYQEKARLSDTPRK